MNRTDPLGGAFLFLAFSPMVIITMLLSGIVDINISNNDSNAIGNETGIGGNCSGSEHGCFAEIDELINHTTDDQNNLSAGENFVDIDEFLDISHDNLAIGGDTAIDNAYLDTSNGSDDLGNETGEGEPSIATSEFLDGPGTSAEPFGIPSAEELWPMAPGNRWLFEDGEGQESFLVEVKSCSGSGCIIQQTYLPKNVTSLLRVIIENDTLFETDSGNESGAAPDFSGIMYPIYHAGDEYLWTHPLEAWNIRLRLNQTTILINGTERVAFSSEHVTSIEHAGRIFESRHISYFVPGQGPVMIARQDGSTHKVKEYEMH